MTLLRAAFVVFCLLLSRAEAGSLRCFTGDVCANPTATPQPTATAPPATPTMGTDTHLLMNSSGNVVDATACTYNTGTSALTCSGAFYLSALDVADGTMTRERLAGPRQALSSFTWTNAMVVALGATTAGDILVATMPTKFAVRQLYVVITGAAAGVTTLTVSCGRTGATYVDYLIASDAKSQAFYGDTDAERGATLDSGGIDVPSYGGGTTALYCHFISTGANLSAVTGSTGRVILVGSLLP